MARLIASLEVSDAPILVPSYGGERGHPVLFRRSVFPELFEDGLAEGARTVVHRHLLDLLEVGVPDPGVLTDIDTPDEYRSHFSEIAPTLDGS